MKYEDLDLIEKAQKDKKLFGLIYIKYFKKIYDYFWFRVGKSRSVAQELVQETFLRAFKNLGSFRRQSSSYFSYLLKISHNLLVNYYRKKDDAVSLDDIDDIPEHSKENLEGGLDAKVVLTKLDTLSPSYKEVLLLKYHHELSIAEIAQKLSKSPSAVKTLLHRARKEFKKNADADITTFV